MKTRPRYTASRIDFALVTQPLAASCVNTMYLPGIKSDHLAFYLAVDQIQNERGRGYWKFNNLLLTDPKFYEQMNEKIEELKLASVALGQIERWSYVKSGMIKEAQKYAKARAADRNIIISQLSEKILEMEHKVASSQNPCQQDLQILQNSKLDIEELLEEKTKGVMFRAKVRWQDQAATKNSKYFFNLEKTRYGAKTCIKLLQEGREVTDQNSIMQQQRDFYQKLYTKDSDAHEFDVTNTSNIKIPVELKEKHEAPFTMEEMKLAIKQMSRNKTPGPSGLTADFYKVFCCKFEEILFAAITALAEEKKLPKEWRKAIINLIPKGHKDSRLLENLCPISLLDVSYKIIEKMISNRLEESLDHIINLDQKGFRKGQRMSANIRKIFDLMAYTEENDIAAVIMTMDFQKCFDKILHSAIFGSLQYFDFADYIIKWTNIIYNDFQAVIQNNGHFTKPFTLERGIRQGGPASSLYFLICAETLAIALRSDEAIKSVEIDEIQHLLGQFADDMDIYLLAQEQSLNRTFKLIESFKKIAGFTINYNKTQIYCIGSLKNTNATLITQRKIAWTNGTISVLGIQINSDLKTCLSENYDPIVVKVKAILKDWARRRMNLIHKVTIVNSLVASLFVHKMMVLPSIPDNITKTVEDEINKFLWNGRKPKISQKRMQNVKKFGRLKLVNLKKRDSALKVTWTLILLGDQKLSQLVYQRINKHLGKDIWLCNLHPRDIKDIMNREMDPFWYDMLKAWAEVKDKMSFSKEYLWYNSYIRISDRTVFWPGTYNKGLKCIHQLYTSSNKNLISCNQVTCNKSI